MTVEIHSITIFPQGAGKLEAKVIFESMEEKTAYVQKESRYCRKEENDYLCSVLPERDAKKNVFLKKRAEFASYMNYAPQKGNKAMWKKSQNTPTKTITIPPKGVA